MSLLREITVAALQPLVRSTTHPTITFDQWLSYFIFDGHQYGLQQTLTGSNEEIAAGFAGMVQGAYHRNGIVFACELARLQLFSEARFLYRSLDNGGRPGELFGDATLAPLRKPWFGGTTGDLLTKALQYADLGGNAFMVRRAGTDAIRLPRPDWITMVLASDRDPDPHALDAEIIGLLYHPGGRGGSTKPEVFTRGEFAHFAPLPDPLSPWRGMSWLTPIVREIQGDSAATDHKLQFFRNGATPNMVVSLDPSIGKDAFDTWVEAFDKQHTGLLNAYKTLYLGGGAKVEVVGKDLQQIDFKVTQGAGETRIAAAAGVPPVIVGLSEGLQAATYSNYGQARRRFADNTMRPLWRNFAGSMETIVPPPRNAELWYDDRDISALQEDRKDAAEIQGLRSRTVRTLLDAGYLAESVTAAVEADDFTLLKHSGLFSVQLQAPGTTPSPDDAGRALASLILPHLPNKE